MDIILILGQISLFIIIISLLGLLTAGFFFASALVRRRFFFPQLTALFISAFESPLKSLMQLFRGDPDKVTEIIIEARNLVFYPEFVRTPYNERVVIVPQCIRWIKCPAKLDAHKGIDCLKCGKCRVKEIIEKGEKLGYKAVGVSPGGTFSKRLLKVHKAKAVIGVACGFELEEGMDACVKYGIAAQGIPLSKGGCINTFFDYDRLFELMEAHIGPKPLPIIGNPKKEKK